MEKKIFFGTKEENNLRREKEFLALSGTERLKLFFDMVAQATRSNENEKKGNLVFYKYK
jgi:hypothetical protein